MSTVLSDPVLSDPVLSEAPSTASLDLRSEVMAVGRSWASAQYRLVRLLRDLDRSGEWALDGAHTCAHWAACRLDVEVGTAREWLRVGETLERLPRIGTSFEQGRISYSKVRMLTRVASLDNEAELLAIAETTAAGRLATEIARWLSRNEEPQDTEARQEEARSLTWRTEPDGMIVGTLRLTPTTAAVVMAAVDTWILRQPAPTQPDTTPTDATDSANGASTDASPTRSVSEWPSIAQQRADGLVALLQDGGASLETEVVLHVRGDGCTLDDGTPIARTAIERIAPAAFLRVLIHDAERRPINASGRHRHPTTRQKRVVHERDQGCIDCGATTLLELDHDPPYTITGRTTIEELHERCWTCHHARHAGDSS